MTHLHNSNKDFIYHFLSFDNTPQHFTITNPDFESL